MNTAAFPWAINVPVTAGTAPNMIRTPVEPRGQGGLIGDAHAIGTEEEQPHVLEAAFGFPFASLAVDEDGTEEMLAALDGGAALESESIKFLVAIGGLQDLVAGVELWTFLQNWTRILEITQGAGVPILVVSMFPGTDQTEEVHLQRMAWNSELATLVSGFMHAQFFWADELLGQNRAEGPEGNLWDIKTEYDEDGEFLNTSGNQALAAALAALEFPLPVVQMAGELQAPKVYDTPGTFTWYKPADARAVRVLLIGGGGGGGGARCGAATGAVGGGAGGNGGAVLEMTFPADRLPASVSIVVGSGGAGGAGGAVPDENGAVGADGGPSSFGAITAPGGGGGGGGTATTAGPTKTGAAVVGSLQGGGGGISDVSNGGAAGEDTASTPGGGGGGGSLADSTALGQGSGGTCIFDGAQFPAENGDDGADSTYDAGPGAGGSGGTPMTAAVGQDGGDGGNYGGGGGGGGAGESAGGAGGAAGGGLAVVTVLR